MKLVFFKKAIALNDAQSEALKVAVLDACRLADQELALREVESQEYAFFAHKLAALKELATKLGLTDDV